MSPVKTRNVVPAMAIRTERPALSPISPTLAVDWKNFACPVKSRRNRWGGGNSRGSANPRAHASSQMPTKHAIDTTPQSSCVARSGVAAVRPERTAVPMAAPDPLTTGSARGDALALCLATRLCHRSKRSGFQLQGVVKALVLRDHFLKQSPIEGVLVHYLVNIPKLLHGLTAVHHELGLATLIDHIRLPHGRVKHDLFGGFVILPDGISNAGSPILLGLLLSDQEPFDEGLEGRAVFVDQSGSRGQHAVRIALVIHVGT